MIYLRSYRRQKTRNREVNRMGKPYSTWQERGYHHLPDTTLPVSQGRPCVRWWPSKRCWGHLESHSGRIGLKPLVMQPVQRRSEIKILKYLELSQHISHSPPTGPFVNTTGWLYYSWYQTPAAMYRRSAFFCNITQPSEVIPWRGILYPWKWDQQIVTKRRCVISTLRCLTSQKCADLTQMLLEIRTYDNRTHWQACAQSSHFSD